MADVENDRQLVPSSEITGIPDIDIPTGMSINLGPICIKIPAEKLMETTESMKKLLPSKRGSRMDRMMRLSIDALTPAILAFIEHKIKTNAVLKVLPLPAPDYNGMNVTEYAIDYMYSITFAMAMLTPWRMQYEWDEDSLTAVATGFEPTDPEAFTRLTSLVKHKVDTDPQRTLGRGGDDGQGENDILQTSDGISGQDVPAS